MKAAPVSRPLAGVSGVLAPRAAAPTSGAGRRSSALVAAAASSSTESSSRGSRGRLPSVLIVPARPEAKGDRPQSLRAEMRSMRAPRGKKMACSMLGRESFFWFATTRPAALDLLLFLFDLSSSSSTSPPLPLRPLLLFLFDLSSSSSSTFPPLPLRPLLLFLFELSLNALSLHHTQQKNRQQRQQENAPRRPRLASIVPVVAPLVARPQTLFDQRQPRFFFFFSSVVVPHRRRGPPSLLQPDPAPRSRRGPIKKRLGAPLTFLLAWNRRRRARRGPAVAQAGAALRPEGDGSPRRRQDVARRANRDRGCRHRGRGQRKHPPVAAHLPGGRVVRRLLGAARRRQGARPRRQAARHQPGDLLLEVRLVDDRTPDREGSLPDLRGPAVGPGPGSGKPAVDHERRRLRVLGLEPGRGGEAARRRGLGAAASAEGSGRSLARRHA